MSGPPSRSSTLPLPRRLTLPLALALALAACGQRGPLYLPDEPGAELPSGERATDPAAAAGNPASASDEVFADNFDEDDEND